MNHPAFPDCSPDRVRQLEDQNAYLLNCIADLEAHRDDLEARLVLSEQSFQMQGKVLSEKWQECAQVEAELMIAVDERAEALSYVLCAENPDLTREDALALMDDCQERLRANQIAVRVTNIQDYRDAEI
ncbi:MAG: hypothetical protein ABJN62_18710 [Halioglobus sp.]